VASKRPLIAALLGAVVVAVVAGLVGSRFATPTQEAANALPPRPSLITASVAFGALDATVPLRADLIDPDPVAVGVPDDLGNSLPIITGLYVKRRSVVHEGEVVMSVAGRPVIALIGRIPAYRDMSLGDQGVDVAQLQAALHRLDLETGDDAPGTYGIATAKAVQALYARLGFQPTVVLPAGSSSPASQPGKKASSAPTVEPSASVPRGEVVFVPSLPERIVSLHVTLGGSAGATLCTIGSGSLVLTGQVDASSVAQVKAGESAVATSDLSGESFRARVSGVSGTEDAATSSPPGAPTYTLTLAPTSTVGSALVGQNLGVTISTGASQTKTWIVPVAAIVTTAGGASSVTVVDSAGRQHTVTVRPGLVAAGQEAVTLIHGGLTSGAQVVIGVGAGP